MGECKLFGMWSQVESELLAELCDLWDIEFIEVTAEGEEILKSVAAQVRDVSYKHLVLGPTSNVNLN